MSSKHDREDAGLAALCDELTARGNHVEITAHPDRSPEHPLTVDALISINETEWAVDHCLLSRPPNLHPAMEEAEEALRGRLDKIARQHGCVVHVSYRPRAQAKRGANSAYYDRVVQLAEQAAANHTELADDINDLTVVQTRPSDTPGAVLAARADTTGTPAVGAQIDAGLRRPLLKKLNHQLRRAKEDGYPTLLLLDQVQQAGDNSRTIWIASPTSVAAAVTVILRDHHASNPRVLDQVWLRPAIPGPPLVAPSIHLLVA